MPTWQSPRSMGSRHPRRPTGPRSDYGRARARHSAVQACRPAQHVHLLNGSELIPRNTMSACVWLTSAAVDGDKETCAPAVLGRRWRRLQPSRPGSLGSKRIDHSIFGPEDKQPQSRMPRASATAATASIRSPVKMRTSAPRALRALGRKRDIGPQTVLFNKPVLPYHGEPQFRTVGSDLVG